MRGGTVARVNVRLSTAIEKYLERVRNEGQAVEKARVIFETEKAKPAPRRDEERSWEQYVEVP
jgi:hypothetical protein